LGTFSDYISGLTLIPGSGGQFEFTIDGDLAFSKKGTGRYPELQELKDLVRDRLEHPPARAHAAKS
jgi:selenoprotein W-related protein